MAGCGATGQQGKIIFYGASFSVEELTKSERPTLHPDDFFQKIVDQSKSRNHLTEPGLF